ncbi:MAG: sigma-54 dependent transcriptional regulator [Acidobacteriota bacterium]
MTSSSSGQRILVVEDRDSLRRMLRRALGAEGYEVHTASDGAAAIDRLRSLSVDLVLTDLRLPQASGLEVLAVARELSPQLPVVVLTGYGTVTEAVEAMKLGARDFLEKPVDIDQLLELCSTYLPAEGSAEAKAPPMMEIPGAPPIVGRHPLLRAALKLLKRVAPTTSTVLLTGESGTGKELFARALHALSPRGSGPFIAVNCAALPESLIENELFGHERGAFTGADRRQKGRFEQADGGTLFLDEIGELPLAVQGKVLRALEEKSFERIGGETTLQTDVRWVAATNRQLASMVEEGSFRGDLYYRLEVFPIELPPLRQRSSDIPQLAHHLLQRLSERNPNAPRSLSQQAEQTLTRQPWPGNVRQLANVLERASILSDGEQLGRTEIEACLQASTQPPAGSSSADPRHSSPTSGLPSTEGTIEAEELALRQALTESAGNKERAAKILGISYRTLQRRIRRWDLEGFPRYRS